MDVPETDKLVKDLYVIEDHFNNAVSYLQKMKEKLDRLKAELQNKKK